MSYTSKQRIHTTRKTYQMFIPSHFHALPVTQNISQNTNANKTNSKQFQNHILSKNQNLYLFYICNRGQSSKNPCLYKHSFIHFCRGIHAKFQCTVSTNQKSSNIPPKNTFPNTSSKPIARSTIHE